MSEPIHSTDPAIHRRLAVDLFDHVWTLLETADRTPAQDDEMLHAAHASRHHWAHAEDPATPQRLAIGEWQCARVYSVLGRAEPAMHHARRCLESCEANPMEDWVLASAYEGLARASKVAGDVAGVERYTVLATEAMESIADEEDRQVIRNDLATL